MVEPLLFILIMACSSAFGQNNSTIQSNDLPEAKQTSLELYVTAAQAFEMWNNDPTSIKVLDVRTLEEYIFVGHADVAVNIPIALQTYNWDEEQVMFAFEPNPDFISFVNEWAEKDDTILVMCRSGGRSAIAVNVLAKEGFKNVYNVVDGFEGDMVKDSLSMFFGKRMKNGWKNSCVPWTFDINSKQVLTIDR